MHKYYVYLKSGSECIGIIVINWTIVRQWHINKINIAFHVFNEYANLNDTDTNEIFIYSHSSFLKRADSTYHSQP